MRYGWLDTATINDKGELRPSPLMRVALFSVVLLVAPVIITMAMALMVLLLGLIALLMPVVFLILVIAPIFGIFQWLAEKLGLYRFVGIPSKKQ